MKTKKIKHVSLKEYATGPNRAEVDFNLKYGVFKPVDHFGVGDIMERPFGFVKEAQELLNFTGMTFDRFVEFLEKHEVTKIEDLGDMSIYKLQESRLWLKESIELVNKVESEQLGSLPSDDEKRAGIEVFAKYRTFPQTDSLAKGDPLKYNAVEKLTYSVCFTKLLLENDRAEFNNRLTKIRSKKK